MAADLPTPASAPDTILTSEPSAGTDDFGDTVPDATAALPYVTNLWHDLPLYLCPACGYDTLLKVRIEAHQLTCRPFIDSQQAPTEPAPDDASPAPEATPPSEEV